MKPHLLGALAGAAILGALLCLFGAAPPNPAVSPFPAISLSGTTNILRDSGTALTRNGAAIGGGGGDTIWTTNYPGYGGYLPNTGVITNVVTLKPIPDYLSFRGIFAFEDPNFTSTNNFNGTNTPTWFASGAPNGGFFFTSEANAYDNSYANGSVVTFQANFSDQATPILGPNPIYSFTANHGNGFALAAGEPIFGICNDYFPTQGFIVVSDLSAGGENRTCRIGINTNTPNADLEIAHWSSPSVAVQKWSGSDGTQLAQVNGDGTISSVNTNRWGLAGVTTGASVTLVTTNYVTVSIDGQTVKLAIVK